MIFRFFGFQGLIILMVAFIIGMSSGGSSVDPEHPNSNLTEEKMGDIVSLALVNATTEVIENRNICENCSRLIKGIVGGAMLGAAGSVESISGFMVESSVYGFKIGRRLMNLLGPKYFWFMMDILGQLMPLFVIILMIMSFSWSAFMFILRRAFWLAIGWYLAKHLEKFKPYNPRNWNAVKNVEKNLLAYGQSMRDNVYKRIYGQNLERRIR